MSSFKFINSLFVCIAIIFFLVSSTSFAREFDSTISDVFSSEKNVNILCGEIMHIEKDSGNRLDSGVVTKNKQSKLQLFSGLGKRLYKLFSVIKPVYGQEADGGCCIHEDECETVTYSSIECIESSDLFLDNKTCDIVSECRKGICIIKFDTFHPLFRGGVIRKACIDGTWLEYQSVEELKDSADWNNDWIVADPYEAMAAAATTETGRILIMTYDGNGTPVNAELTLDVPNAPLGTFINNLPLINTTGDDGAFSYTTLTGFNYQVVAKYGGKTQTWASTKLTTSGLTHAFTFVGVSSTDPSTNTSDSCELDCTGTSGKTSSGSYGSAGSKYTVTCGSNSMTCTGATKVETTQNRVKCTGGTCEQTTGGSSITLNQNNGDPSRVVTTERYTCADVGGHCENVSYGQFRKCKEYSDIIITGGGGSLPNFDCEWNTGRGKYGFCCRNHNYNSQSPGVGTGPVGSEACIKYCNNKSYKCGEITSSCRCGTCASGYQCNSSYQCEYFGSGGTTPGSNTPSDPNSGNGDLCTPICTEAGYECGYLPGGCNCGNCSSGVCNASHKCGSGIWDSNDDLEKVKEDITNYFMYNLPDDDYYNDSNCIPHSCTKSGGKVDAIVKCTFNIFGNDLIIPKKLPTKNATSCVTGIEEEEEAQDITGNETIESEVWDELLEFIKQLMETITNNDNDSDDETTDNGTIEECDGHPIGGVVLTVTCKGKKRVTKEEPVCTSTEYCQGGGSDSLPAICVACPDCTDCIKNQNETAIDCGGPNCDDCTACASNYNCSDGQNCTGGYCIPDNCPAPSEEDEDTDDDEESVGECTEGQKKCGPGSSKYDSPVMMCNSNETWQEYSDCHDGYYCSNGYCVEEEICNTKSDKRCRFVGNMSWRQVCSDLGVWADQRKCPAGCQDGKCLEEGDDVNYNWGGTCSKNWAKRCAGGGGKIWVEECVDNTWRPSESCSNGCQDGACLINVESGNSNLPVDCTNPCKTVHSKRCLSGDDSGYEICKYNIQENCYGWSFVPCLSGKKAYKIGHGLFTRICGCHDLIPLLEDTVCRFNYCLINMKNKTVFKTEFYSNIVNYLSITPGGMKGLRLVGKNNVPLLDPIITQDICQFNYCLINMKNKIVFKTGFYSNIVNYLSIIPSGMKGLRLVGKNNVPLPAPIITPKLCQFDYCLINTQDELVFYSNSYNDIVNYVNKYTKGWDVLRVVKRYSVLIYAQA